ncbi:hypothetical protein WJX72_011648 [[Myrmecia] bisecta]|uniref:Uncharacterized protein n=1 Tax=[Myrmecia] bisecta TaxID=41462 RepID=A0AAW1RB06_9CHLO
MLRGRLRCCARQTELQPEESCRPRRLLLSALAGAAISALIAFAPASTAAIETVSASSVTEQARSLPKQQVKKGEVWLVFLLGAASLFGATVLLENNENFFPAISKANKALAETKKQQQERATDEQVIDMTAASGEFLSTEQIESIRMEAAVEAGLQEALGQQASQKVAQKQ